MIRAQVLREVIRSSYNAKNDPYLRFSMKHITILIIDIRILDTYRGFPESVSTCLRLKIYFRRDAG